MASSPVSQRARLPSGTEESPAAARAPGGLVQRAAPWFGSRDAIGAGAASDGGSRRALFASLGRTAGNAAVAQLARPQPVGVQREPPAGVGSATGGAAATGGADAAARYMLTNARFTGQARLQDIASGGPSLSKSDPKAAVQPVQTALLDVGYSLLRYKDDGKFGSETSTAIEQFRADSKVTDGEGFNAAALKILDKRAPAPGKLEQHYLDYGRLFADNRLDVTLAIGYDEGGTHAQDVASARDWFEQHKLKRTSGGQPAKAEGPEGADPKAKKDESISVPETWEGKWSVTYPDATGTRVSKEITLSVTLVPPGTGGKAAFAKGLNESELTLYSGHARRGIGPDFDADKSKYENFVIGVNSALHKAGRLVAPTAVEQSHYVIGKKNDLEEMNKPGKWDEEKYRVWFFAACSSIAYVDELRGGLLPEKMDRHNLDIFGTIHTIPIAAGLAPVFSNLEGILAAETMEQIVERMQRSSLDALRKRVDELNVSEKRKAAVMKEYAGQMFMREGAGDNQVAPQTP